MTQKNMTKIEALAQKGLRWCSESKALEIFGQILELAKPVDKRGENLEKAEKAKRRAAPK